MKPEEIIMMDMAREALNYKGPVFLRLDEKILENNGRYLLEVRTRHCGRCHKQTSQEWVRNHHFDYWRCSECLDKQLKKVFEKIDENLVQGKKVSVLYSDKYREITHNSKDSMVSLQGLVRGQILKVPEHIYLEAARKLEQNQSLTHEGSILVKSGALDSDAMEEKP